VQKFWSHPQIDKPCLLIACFGLLLGSKILRFDKTWNVSAELGIFFMKEQVEDALKR
jgi:hypothetical protein